MLKLNDEMILLMQAETVLFFQIIITVFEN